VYSLNGEIETLKAKSDNIRIKIQERDENLSESKIQLDSQQREIEKLKTEVENLEKKCEILKQGNKFRDYESKTKAISIISLDDQIKVD